MAYKPHGKQRRILVNTGKGALDLTGHLTPRCAKRKLNMPRRRLSKKGRGENEWSKRRRKSRFSSKREESDRGRLPCSARQLKEGEGAVHHPGK